MLTFPGDTYRQVFSGELVNDAQHPERLSIMGAVRDEVVGPDMVGTLRAQPYARPVIEPKTSTFGLFDRDFQPLTSPDPFNALLVHRPPGASQHRRNPAIPVAPVLASKFDDVGSQCGFIIGRPRNPPLRRSMLTQGPACPSLGDAKLGGDMIHACTASGGA
jgi:hypothetical protein